MDLRLIACEFFAAGSRSTVLSKLPSVLLQFFPITFELLAAVAQVASVLLDFVFKISPVRAWWIGGRCVRKCEYGAC